MLSGVIIYDTVELVNYSDDVSPVVTISRVCQNSFNFQLGKKDGIPLT